MKLKIGLHAFDSHILPISAKFSQSKILRFSYIPEIIRMAMGLIQITKNLVSNVLIRVQFPPYDSEGLTLETSPSDIILFFFAVKI